MGGGAIIVESVVGGVSWLVVRQNAQCAQQRVVLLFVVVVFSREQIIWWSFVVVVLLMFLLFLSSSSPFVSQNNALDQKWRLHILSSWWWLPAVRWIQYHLASAYIITTIKIHSTNQLSVRSKILSKLMFLQAVWYSDRAYYGLLCVLIEDNIVGRRLLL